MKNTCMNCNYRNSPLTEYPCKYCDECKLWKPKESCSEFAISELKKLKAEIEEHGNKANVNKNEYELAISQTCDYISIIIDNHIKELKGENND